MARQLDVMVVRIPPEVKKEFDKKAKEFDLSMSQIARRLVEDWLKKDLKSLLFNGGSMLLLEEEKFQQLDLFEENLPYKPYCSDQKGWLKVRPKEIATLKIHSTQ